MQHQTNKEQKKQERKGEYMDVEEKEEVKNEKQGQDMDFQEKDAKKEKWQDMNLQEKKEEKKEEKKKKEKIGEDMDIQEKDDHRVVQSSNDEDEQNHSMVEQTIKKLVSEKVGRMDNNSKSTINREQTLNEKTIKIEITIKKHKGQLFEAKALATYIINNKKVKKEYYKYNNEGLFQVSESEANECTIL